ncbi:MAG: ROK family protein [Candidatus Eremiobacteraeota bacterium]|nr:ROK family protein [Candidatus Eremiobacteraeota bacterium]
MAKTVLGVDLGGSHLAAAVVDVATGEISLRHELQLRDRSVDFVVESILAFASQISQELEAKVDAIGIGSPGNVDTRDGIVRSSPNFGWRDAPIGQAISSRSRADVRVMNDARCAAYGEYLYGSGRGARSFVLLTLGTGIGGGIVIDGALLMGNAMGAGEIGHHTIKAQGGFPCSCRRLGCFEAHASATGLLRHARMLEASYPRSKLLHGDATTIGSRVVQEAAAAGEVHAVAAWNNYVDDLAVGVSNVIGFLDPEVIAIGGGVAGAGDFLIAELRERVAARTVTVPPGRTTIVAADFLGDAGLVGAAAFAANGVVHS